MDLLERSSRRNRGRCDANGAELQDCGICGVWQRVASLHIVEVYLFVSSEKKRRIEEFNYSSKCNLGLYDYPDNIRNLSNWVLNKAFASGALHRTVSIMTIMAAIVARPTALYRINKAIQSWKLVDQV
ncbi:hypothetical protein IEQ34_023076 [Dendrobium chrysotoxum]|uniref:Uncharacterized protein n=1 Tax=Dendrobium chrysotoxum TaxID=161865 RepID=A0AAV7FZ94_DENCH|nr:hypothetical protein IEQ34_023076 [Dendrobium chrysotoxum]